MLQRGIFAVRMAAIGMSTPEIIVPFGIDVTTRSPLFRSRMIERSTFAVWRSCRPRRGVASLVGSSVQNRQNIQ